MPHKSKSSKSRTGHSSHATHTALWSLSLQRTLPKHKPDAGSTKKPGRLFLVVILLFASLLTVMAWLSLDQLLELGKGLSWSLEIHAGTGR